jgi:hypothetical protein
VITDLGRKAKPDLKFEGVKIEKENGRQILKVAIANKGNLYCKPIVVIEMYDKKSGQNQGLFSQSGNGSATPNLKIFSY